jgi:SOS-response transcriptional repressor LexA
VARKKTPKIRVNVKASLSRRLREIRQEIFGDHGGPELARRLNLPARTWYNYETGVTVPAEVLLGFIEQTGANPEWLLSGEGPRFRHSSDDRRLSDLSPVEMIRRGLEELERTSTEAVVVAPENLPSGQASEFVAIGIYPLSMLCQPVLDHIRLEGHVMAYRHWLPNPAETVGTRLVDDSMNPILPAGSIVAVDRSVTDPQKLHGRIVAACPDGVPMIRWLEVSGRHVILRPNNVGRDFSLIPVDVGESASQVVIGQVVWSWSRFNQT